MFGSGKHIRAIIPPFTPLLNSKTAVSMGIHIILNPKQIVGTRNLNSMF